MKLVLTIAIAAAMGVLSAHATSQPKMGDCCKEGAPCCYEGSSCCK